MVLERQINAEPQPCVVADRRSNGGEAQLNQSEESRFIFLPSQEPYAEPSACCPQEAAAFPPEFTIVQGNAATAAHSPRAPQ